VGSDGGDKASPILVTGAAGNIQSHGSADSWPVRRTEPKTSHVSEPITDPGNAVKNWGANLPGSPVVAAMTLKKA
jgi:hypothetical protein